MRSLVYFCSYLVLFMDTLGYTLLHSWSLKGKLILLQLLIVLLYIKLSFEVSYFLQF